VVRVLINLKDVTFGLQYSKLIAYLPPYLIHLTISPRYKIPITDPLPPSLQVLTVRIICGAPEYTMTKIDYLPSRIKVEYARMHNIFSEALGTDEVECTCKSKAEERWKKEQMLEMKEQLHL